MKKITLTLTLLWIAGTSFAQSSNFDELSNFSKIIIKGNVKEVKFDPDLDSDISVDGAYSNQIELVQGGESVEINITSQNPVVVVVGSRNVRWIEASADTKITGAEYLIGGTGKFLVLGTDWNRNKVKHSDKHKYKYKYKYSLGDLDIGYNFSKDFDFDFDIDYDFDFDFDFDIDLGDKWDNDWDHN